MAWSLQVTFLSDIGKFWLAFRWNTLDDDSTHQHWNELTRLENDLSGIVQIPEWWVWQTHCSYSQKSNQQVHLHGDPENGKIQDNMYSEQPLFHGGTMYSKNESTGTNFLVLSPLQIWFSTKLKHVYRANWSNVRYQPKGLKPSRWKINSYKEREKKYASMAPGRFIDNGHNESLVGSISY